MLSYLGFIGQISPGMELTAAIAGRSMHGNVRLWGAERPNHANKIRFQ